MRSIPIAIVLVIVAFAFDGAAQGPPNDPVTQGKSTFFAQGCHGCHTLGTAGTPIANDLSRIGRKYSRSDLEAWLRDPTAVKATAHMPRLDLTDREVSALAAFLASLEGS